MPKSTTDSAAPSPLQTASRPAYDATRELWVIEENLRNYNAGIVGLLRRPFGPDAKVLDFGAGIGTLALLWQAATGRAPECAEIDPALQAVIAGRGFVCHGSIDAMGPAYDGVYTSNVLEHIEDDVAALRTIHGVLRPGATLAVYVPALRSLHTGLDVIAGHYRRYGRRELVEKLRLAGFEPVDCHYADSIGYFATLAVKVLGYREGMDLESARSLRLYDRWIFPLSRTLDALGVRRLFGKNLFAVARKV